MNTRREFLAMLAAAAVPRVRHAERPQTRGPAQRVIVLGAGLAGLCTAYELQRLGHTVIVVSKPKCDRADEARSVSSKSSPSEGRIHFAGEHTSAWTGWMQGALESARRVVREIT